MRRNPELARLTLAALILVVCSPVAVAPTKASDPATEFSSASASGGNRTERLALAEFISSQGSTSTFVPPVPDFLAWSGPPPDYPYLGGMDYTGLANDWLVANGGASVGTQVRGSFIRRNLVGGKVQYSVDLYTSNAISYMWSLPLTDFLTDPLLFGARAQEILAGAPAALGGCHLHAVWRQNAGEPVPDLMWAALGGPQPAGWELIQLYFRGEATGVLHEEAGLGPEGTPGIMVISQTGNISLAGGNGANADGFPAEVVALHVIGN